MTVQTTTLPAAPATRVGANVPVRRRALVPQQPVVAAPVLQEEQSDPLPTQEEQQQEELLEQQDAQEQSDQDGQDGQGDPPHLPADTLRTVAQAPTQVKRGRGRPRKADTASAPATDVSYPPPASDAELIGMAAIRAVKAGISLEDYIADIRGTLDAYDRLLG